MTPTIPQVTGLNGDIAQFLTEHCQEWYDECGGKPLSLAAVGKLVRENPEAAPRYRTADGIAFDQINRGKILEPLAAAKQWALFEQILGIDPADWVEPIQDSELEELGTVLKELGIK